MTVGTALVRWGGERLAAGMGARETAETRAPAAV